MVKNYAVEVSAEVGTLLALIFLADFIKKLFMVCPHF